MIAVSACLAGIECRYNGTAATTPMLQKTLIGVPLITICPEVLGGLPVPREPAEISGGDGFAVLAGNARVVDRNGKDVTHAFVQGAKCALAVLKENNIPMALFKDKSPSCGVQHIYKGDFSNQLVQGCGVTTALLLDNGITVINEHDHNELKYWLQQNLAYTIRKGVENEHKTNG